MAALTRRQEPRRYELRSVFGLDLGEPGRDMREPLFQSQERGLQPFKRSGSHQKCNRKPQRERECVAVIVGMSVIRGENACRYFPAYVMICVQTVGNVAEIDESGILQERGPLARSSEEGQEDCNTCERHKWIPDHAAGQCWYGIKQSAKLANDNPRRASQQKQHQPLANSKQGRFASLKDPSKQNSTGD